MTIYKDSSLRIRLSDNKTNYKPIRMKKFSKDMKHVIWCVWANDEDFCHEDCIHKFMCVAKHKGFIFR